MKIMWFTFSPIGRAAEILFGTKTQSGGWIDATLNSILPKIKDNSVMLEIVALDERGRTITDAQTGVIYKTVDVSRKRGKRGKSTDVSKFNALIEEFSPDIIQIWGTEFTFGLDVIEAANGIPVCFYIQGVMSSLVKHPLGDLSSVRLFFDLGISSFFKFRSLRKWHKINEHHIAYEAQMISRSSGLLLDNNWTRAQYCEFTNRFYHVPLAMNECFAQKEWSIEQCQKHTLFTVAGGICPQKGVHDAVLAVSKLKEKYPDIKLFIPGAITARKPRFLYDSIYIRHIRKIIKRYDLQDNICFVGRLSHEEMADRMASSHAFIMPSAVETHSSSLREAMLVGVPSVDADVGSVPEFVRHGENGFIYRYGEPETLAYYIDRIFSDDVLAEKLGKKARETVIQQFPQNKIGNMLISAYRKIITYGRTPCEK